jgi:DMSO/TMAO reductase YedYZ molybdopterin-dependent catalytic subunit
MRAMDLSRRQMLGAGLAWTGMTWLSAFARVASADKGAIEPLVERLAAAASCPASGPLGELLGLMPLSPERGQVLPFGEMYGGTGLDARLLNDLSLLEPDKLITPSERVFVRTACPPSLIGRKGPWHITTGGLATKTGTLSLDEIARDARPMGAHIIECSGNANPRNFGLLSVAEWDGIPLAPIVDRLGPKAEATGVLVSGVDHEASASGRSEPTASWVYPLAALDRTGAFLATRMNGAPLPPDHGAPVRMSIPGWYGCTWIKWVNEIRLVGPDEPATAQMREFAARTEQTGVPELARDYKPAEIDLTGTPVRVEKRRIDGRIEYRIVGIIWGGDRPVDRMRIGFGKDEWTEISICPAPKTHKIWSMWEHRWRPTAPGLYDIALKSTDSSIRTRRLDRGYYMRQVRIDEI